MRGNPDVIAKLNEALQEELTAINQYFVHAEMCHNWGYHRLGNYIKKQSIGEMKHAEESSGAHPLSGRCAQHAAASAHHRPGRACAASEGSRARNQSRRDCATNQ